MEPVLVLILLPVLIGAGAGLHLLGAPTAGDAVWAATDSTMSRAERSARMSADVLADCRMVASA